MGKKKVFLSSFKVNSLKTQIGVNPQKKTWEDAACRSLIARHTGKKKKKTAHAGFPFLSALAQCLRHRVLIGRFPLAVCPALHTAPQDIRAPMTSCVGRFRRDQRTRKDWLLFILHRQSFTIMQPDRRLIAVTPSPRWACPLRLPPFSLNSEEPSPLFIYRSREEKELEEECESGFTHCSFLHFAHFPFTGILFFWTLFSKSSTDK